MGSTSNAKVTVGLPVYNGEAYIRRAVDSVLSQTFTDFELIISDNASTDSTSTICKEYVEKDQRIAYTVHERNIGPIFNFLSVLSKAKSDYFVWISDDDYWEPTFLEKNLEVLESNNNIVGSIGLVEFDDEHARNNKSFISNLKNFSTRSDINMNKYLHVHPVFGTYEKKAGIYLRFNQASFIYGVFRTEKLRKRWVDEKVIGWDGVILLNILKEGDFNVVDEILMHRSSSGVRSNSGLIAQFKKKHIPFYDLIIPFSSYWIWIIKNIGLGFFLRNMDWVILYTIYGWYSIFNEITNIKN